MSWCGLGGGLLDVATLFRASLLFCLSSSSAGLSVNVLAWPLRLCRFLFLWNVVLNGCDVLSFFPATPARRERVLGGFLAD